MENNALALGLAQDRIGEEEREATAHDSEDGEESCERDAGHIDAAQVSTEVRYFAFLVICFALCRSHCGGVFCTFYIRCYRPRNGRERRVINVHCVNKNRQKKSKESCYQ